MDPIPPYQTAVVLFGFLCGSVAILLAPFALGEAVRLIRVWRIRRWARRRSK